MRNRFKKGLKVKIDGKNGVITHAFGGVCIVKVDDKLYIRYNDQIVQRGQGIMRRFFNWVTNF